VLWRKLVKTVQDGPQRELNIGAGTALGFAIRIAGYALAALTGIVVARALGPHSRGVYSLVTTTAITYASFSELGLSPAGLYVVGQKQSTLRNVLGNNFLWLIGVGAIWTAVNLAAAIFRPAFLPDSLEPVHFLIFAVAGVAACALTITKDGLLASGSILAFGLVDFLEPFFRCLLIVTAVVAFGVGIDGVLLGWTMAIGLALLLALRLLSHRVSLTVGLDRATFRKQMGFGFRGYLGWLLQSANYRLDVFLVAAFVGHTELGFYAVAFGAAEMLWQIPFALGTVFFPKVVAMDPDENAEIAAVTCRRALFITLIPTLGAVLAGRFLIETAYGSEFSPAVVSFYILAPSALLYTVHRVLSSALAARGMPETTLYGGLASVPITVGLGLWLIPAWGIEGAAVTSMAAYAANALCITAIFSIVTKKSIPDIMLINRLDVSWSLQTARTFLARSDA
jgi:O-antigen/teichoic acid export membrane protein